jgi:16S rRNA (cytosine1402-N4)-methyltransferase
MWVDVEEDRNAERSRRYEHTTVLRHEAVGALGARAGGVYVDATVGCGGHAEALLEAVPDAVVIGLDRDPAAVAASAERLERFGKRARLVHASFGDLEAVLRDGDFTPVDGVLADLGVSSAQLDEPSRGMSFRAEGPLDMRMDPTRGETALELVRRLGQDDLANLLYRFGEERRSRRVAKCVKAALGQGRLETTLDLRRAVVRAVGPVRVGGVDPATRTFQALRVAVNAELEQLEHLLAAARAVLAPGAVIAVISFHSLEDRLVKHELRRRDLWAPLWKKPVGPSEAEARGNPRSRSARLRAARRLPAGGGGADGASRVVS